MVGFEPVAVQLPAACQQHDGTVAVSWSLLGGLPLPGASARGRLRFWVFALEGGPGLVGIPSKLLQPFRTECLTPTTVPRPTLPLAASTVASCHLVCQQDGPSASIASKSSGTPTLTVAYLPFYAPSPRTTSLGTTSTSTFLLDLGPFTSCTPRTSRRSCRAKLKVPRPPHACRGVRNAKDVPDFGFGCRPAVFAPLLGNGIFTQEGAAWKHSRELLRKQFVRAQYRDLQSFHKHAANLISCLPVDGDVDLQPLFFNYTMDVATEALFGRSVYTLRAQIDQAEENRVFGDSFNVAQEGLAKRFRLAPFHFLYNPPSFREACKTVHGFVERYIDEQGFMEKTGVGKQDAEDADSWFISQVAKESTSVSDLRDQLLNVLFAGRDSTACCLSWTL